MSFDFAVLAKTAILLHLDDRVGLGRNSLSAVQTRHISVGVDV